MRSFLGDGEKETVSSISVLIIVVFFGVDDCERFRFLGVNMSSMSSASGDGVADAPLLKRASEVRTERRRGDEVAWSTFDVSCEIREVRMI